MKRDRRHYLDSDTRRTCEGVLIVLGLASLIVMFSLLAIRAARGQAIVDVILYDAIHGQQEITCHMDTLSYSCASGCGAAIRCHSDADVIFRNGFEDLPPWAP